MSDFNLEMLNILKGRKYLIVEDDITLSTIMCETFDKLGIKYFLAKNGDQALEIIDNTYIDAVITDLNMPGMNGMELCSQIKKKYNKPVIMLSGNREESIIQAADEVGVHTFMFKPLNFIDFFHLLTLINYENFKTNI